MANEIIQQKYQDIISINPKYHKVIDTKLATVSRDTFAQLVNRAIDEIMLCRDNEPSWYNSHYHSYFYKYRSYKNQDGDWVNTKELVCVHSNCAELQLLVPQVSGGRLTHYVRLNLLRRYFADANWWEDVDNAYGCRRNVYYYSFPDDFFVTNDLHIKFYAHIEPNF